MPPYANEWRERLVKSNQQIIVITAHSDRRIRAVALTSNRYRIFRT